MDDDKIILIPLLAKESSDERHFRIIKGLIIALIVSNLAWMTSWGVYHVCHCIAENTELTQNVEEDTTSNF